MTGPWWLRNLVHWWLPWTLAVLGIAAGVWLIAVPGMHRRHTVEHNLSACHARGPDFHWWDERQRCVRYVDVSS